MMGYLLRASTTYIEVYLLPPSYMLLFQACEVMSSYVLSQRGLDVYMM